MVAMGINDLERAKWMPGMEIEQPWGFIVQNPHGNDTDVCQYMATSCFSAIVSFKSLPSFIRKAEMKLPELHPLQMYPFI